MAVIATLSVTISFELPVLVLTIFSPSQHNGWETFVGGLEMPSASFMDATWLWQNHSMGWLMLISWTGSAYGTILTYLTLATAFWSRENRCKSIGRLVSGMTVVCAAGTASFFFNDGSPTGALKGPLLGYYLWLLGLGGIWLAHAPQRNKVGWTHFAAVAGLLALIASAMKSTG
ncbi:MAG: hypothetical protein MPJ50_10755 [Pirellulales bacterium]|nr:hypothetical protein [Pirellulales bacterium]